MMNQTPDRLLVDWLADGPDKGPQHGLERTLAATRRTSQRPRWTFASTWLPAPLAARPTAMPRSFAILIAAALLAVALAAAVLLAGSARRAAPPFGLAGNGSIVLDVDGRLWQANPDGSDPRPFAAKTLGLATTPVFSPDGTRVAYQTRPDLWTPNSIFVANADGTGARNVTGDMKVVAGPLEVPAWSPDGLRLAFTSSDGGSTRIYTVGADGSGLTVISPPDGDRNHPVWSPDGDWLAYQRRPLDPEKGTQLAISRPDGSDERTLMSSEDRGEGVLVTPQWNPDSTRLAYETGAFRQGVVGVVDLAGNRTPVSLEGEDAFNPVWSADGRQLLYSYDGATVVDVADPSNRIEIAAGFADCAATWAPDATAILGYGPDCTTLVRIPLSDPTVATPVDVPAGLINNASWQRTAP